MVTQTIYGVRKRSFRPTPKAGEQPFAPTPLSHSAGEGLGVRAIQRACPFTPARFVALTPSPSPTLWERGVGANGCSPAFGVGRKLRFRTPYIVCVTMRTP